LSRLLWQAGFHRIRRAATRTPLLTSLLVARPAPSVNGH